VIDGTGQGRFESNKVSAAFRCADIVDKGKNRFCIAGIVLKGHLNDHIVTHVFKINGLGIYDGLVLIQILDKFSDRLPCNEIHGTYPFVHPRW